MIDFRVSNHGSICLLRPCSDAADAWCEEYLPEDASWLGGACAVEPRYLLDILSGIEGDGLEVSVE